jgi:hypothetical protein
VLCFVAYARRDAIKDYYHSLFSRDAGQSAQDTPSENVSAQTDDPTASRPRSNTNYTTAQSQSNQKQATVKPFNFRKVKSQTRIAQDFIVVKVPASVKLNSPDYQQRMNATKVKIQAAHGSIPIKVSHPSMKGYVEP